MGSIGVVIPGVIGNGGGPVYYAPYNGNDSPAYFPTPPTVYGGPQCSMTPPACGAEFQPGTAYAVTKEESNNTTGNIVNSQSAIVGEWVPITPNGNGVGPYYSSGQVRENLSVSVYLAPGAYNISESWHLQGEAALSVWGVSKVGGNLTASYAMYLGLEILSCGGGGFKSIQQLPYSSAQIGCVTPCNITTFHPLSGSSLSSFNVVVPVAGSYAVIPFLLWNTTARETGYGDAAASSCLSLGSASWCPLASGGMQLAAGWGLLQSITIA